jgi:small nuclear ribonucleoprotein (snRNP)-like protein
MSFDSSIGLEEVQRAALVRLFRHLNTAITERQTLKEAEDEAMADFLGREYVPVELETIEPENFYEGHRPSLIRAPITAYPNCAVWAVRATPHPESARSDHTDIYNVLLFVEVMCKSIDSEDIVNKRIVRTAEAVGAVMSDDETLGGVVTGFSNTVSPSLSDVFTRKEKTTFGAVWFWQGARLEYVVRKDAIRYLPSGSSSAQNEFFKSLPDGMTPADWAALDQS